MYDCFKYTKEMVVVDIGAHKGVYSLYVAEKVKRVVSFEPVSETADVLEENIRINKKRNILVVRKAILDHNGEALIFIPKIAGSASFVLKRGRPRKVDVKTLDYISYFVSKGQKILIKIDVEGAELKIIKKGLEFIKKYKPNIVIELHKDVKIKKLIEILESMGMKVSIRNYFIGPIFYSSVLCAGW